MSHLRLPALVAFALSVAPGAALAADKAAAPSKHDQGKAEFAKADLNHDGFLDKEEAKAMPNVSKSFDAIDKNKDGKVSLDEIHAFMKANSGKKK